MDTSWRIVLARLGIVVISLLTSAGFFCLHNVPSIPSYPNAVGNTVYPQRIETQLLGESFGVVYTADSYAEVIKFYRQQFMAEGWKDGWYRNHLGTCFTLLLIHNIPPATDPSLTSVSLKLRQRFSREEARADCS